MVKKRSVFMILKKHVRYHSVAAIVIAVPQTRETLWVKKQEETMAERFVSFASFY